MAAPTFNTVAWIQIGTDDPKDAERFFGELFGWRFVPDPGSDGNYTLVGYPESDGFAGGIFDTQGESPNHAIFVVVVEDVPAAVAQAETLGGSVLVPPTTRPNGLVFAELRDPAGNHFGVFSPPSAS